MFGVGLGTGDEEGASEGLGDPGSSFLRVGARSIPFPWGEFIWLSLGEMGSLIPTEKRM